MRLTEQPPLVVAKYHGLGNDFVLIDRRGRAPLSPDIARWLCDRHLGVGADGVLALHAEPDGTPRMRVHNADGSIADMCGNGLRCFVRWLCDELGHPVRPFVVMAECGPQDVEPIAPQGLVSHVRVNLGAATVRGEAQVTLAERVYDGVDLSVGNPHFVIPRGLAAGELEAVGLRLSTHAFFPRGANIEWLEVRDTRHALVTVWERGCGPTQACGTGGGAAAATGVRLGLLAADTDLVIQQPGGALTYRVAADLSSVWMTGPAEPVWFGQLRGTLAAQVLAEG